jgi:uncharacterized protein YndB with AHSA1/START domain
MTDPLTDLPVISTEGTIAAPPEIVYAAFTDAAMLQRWWAAWTSCLITTISIDARRGGLYRIESSARNNRIHFFQGEFLHLSPTIIAVTWVTEDSIGFNSNVCFTLTPAGDSRTHLLVEHRGIHSDRERKRMTSGWPQLVRIMQQGMPRLDLRRVPPEIESVVSREKS